MMPSMRDGCWVTSQVSGGRVRRSASRNIGQNHGIPPLLMGSFDFSQWLRENVRAVPRQEIGFDASAGVVAGPRDATPVPPPFGDLRQFKIAGSSVAALLHSPAGEQGAPSEITLMWQFSSVATMTSRTCFRPSRTKGSMSKSPCLTRLHHRANWERWPTGWSCSAAFLGQCWMLKKPEGDQQPFGD